MPNLTVGPIHLSFFQHAMAIVTPVRPIISRGKVDKVVNHGVNQPKGTKLVHHQRAIWACYLQRCRHVSPLARWRAPEQGAGHVFVASTGLYRPNLCRWLVLSLVVGMWPWWWWPVALLILQFLFLFLFLLVFLLALLPPAVTCLSKYKTKMRRGSNPPRTSLGAKKYSLSTGGFLVPNLESVPTGKRQRWTVVFLADDQSHSNIAVVSPVRRLGETLNSTSSCRESAYPIPLEMSPL